MSLLVQVLAGAASGFALIWAMTIVGTRLSERRRGAAISAWQARAEINAVRRAALRQLLQTSRAIDHRSPTDHPDAPR